MNVKSTRPLEIEVSARGVLPRKFVLDAAYVLKGNDRVEVMPSPDGISLRCVWEEDADFAIDQLRKSLKYEIKISRPRILYEKEEGRLMEPIMGIAIVVPEEFLGEVIGDINRRRRLVRSVSDEGKNKLIEAHVPLAELFGYRVDLIRNTNNHVKVNVKVEYVGYQPVPPGEGPEPDEPKSVALRA